MTTRTRITAGIATGLIAAVLVPAAAIGYTDTGTPTAGGGSDSTFVPSCRVPLTRPFRSSRTSRPSSTRRRPRSSRPRSATTGSSSPTL